MRATDSIWLGAAVVVGTGLAVIGAVNGAAVALFRFSGLRPHSGHVADRARCWDANYRRALGRTPAAAVVAVGRGYLLGLPNLFWLALLMLCRGCARVCATRSFGRELYLTGTNRRAAAFNGLARAATRFLAFLISGGLAGLAGVLLSSGWAPAARSSATTCC